jgi:hypothetical protein
MPRGIPNNPKKKKKAAKKQASVKRAYTRRIAQTEQQPEVPMEQGVKRKTIREEIVDLLTARGVRFTDMDGHISIDNGQMVDVITMEDLITCGVQAINARASMKGPYIAIYY